jgi:hypothetical protein
LAVVGLLFVATAGAEELRLPLVLDGAFVESLVRSQVFTGADGSVRLNDNGTGCQFLELREPRISTSAGRVQLRTRAWARAGRAVGGRCMLLVDWRGQLEFAQAPTVGADRRSVLLRTVSWRALTPDGQTATLSTTIGRWIEQFLPLQLQETRIDLAPPLEQLRGFLALVVTREDAARVSAMLDSVAVADVAAGDDRLAVTLGLDVPPLPALPPPTAGPFTDAELALLEGKLAAVDAFVTYTIRQLTVSPAAADDMDALLDILLDMRLALVAIVAEPTRGPDDPVRRLFVATWEQLAPVLQKIAARQPDHQNALRYLSFIAAGDMLRALDRMGPAAGLDLSRDGLRRLARILVPQEQADPLEQDDAVDPELRRRFGFGEPLPPPENTSATSWLDWFVAPAHAARRPDAKTVKRLNNWVPKYEDMDSYLPMVRDVLNHVVQEQLRARDLARGFHEVFRQLVLTAAWQESCWRQFMVRGNKRVPMQSATGDIGMMQINPSVWRGFYDLHGLKWDIVYNARAGADILQHHMVTYAIGNGEHKRNGRTDNLARAAYAAYNGGPRQYDRYRRGDAPAHGRKVDAVFYEKFRAVKAGRELAVKSCFKG